MFFIKVLFKGELTGKSWQHNEQKPEVHPHAKIVHFDATGAGLDYIRLRFRNLPIVTGNSCVWGEPWAQFVFDNLKD